jgi:hypothetical protein
VVRPSRVTDGNLRWFVVRCEQTFSTDWEEEQALEMVWRAIAMLSYHKENRLNSGHNPPF